MRCLSYCLIKIHRKFTSAYLLCDKASLRAQMDLVFYCLFCSRFIRSISFSFFFFCIALKRFQCQWSRQGFWNCHESEDFRSRKFSSLYSNARVIWLPVETPCVSCNQGSLSLQKYLSRFRVFTFNFTRCLSLFKSLGADLSKRPRTPLGAHQWCFRSNKG
jgi:hypothetical protein